MKFKEDLQNQQWEKIPLLWLIYADQEYRVWSHEISRFLIVATMFPNTKEVWAPTNTLTFCLCECKSPSLADDSNNSDVISAFVGILQLKTFAAQWITTAFNALFSSFQTYEVQLTN